MSRLTFASLLLSTAALLASTGCITIIEPPPDGSARPGDSNKPPAPACAANPWAKTFPGIAAKPGGVAPDGACGVIFTAGGQTDFGTGETGEVASLAIVRLDASGHPLWARHFAHDIGLEPPRVALDPHGDILIAGVAGTPFDLGKGEIAAIGQADIYVAKLDPQGELVWARRFGGPMYNHDRHSLEAFALSPDGDLLLAGFYETEIDFGLGPLVAPDQASAGFVVKLDASGQPIWQRGFVASSDTLVNAGLGGAAFGASGEVLIAGWSGGQLDPGTGPFTASPHTVSTFVAAYESDGKPIWSRAFAGTGEAIPHALAVDAAGDIIVAGRITGSMQLGGLEIEGGWSQTGCYFKLDGSGNALFAGHFDDMPAGLAVDANRNIILVTSGVIKLDPNGSPLWLRGSDTPNAYWGFRRDAVAVDTGGNVLVTSVAGNDLDLGVVAIEAGSGQPPTFVANLGP